MKHLFLPFILALTMMLGNLQAKDWLWYKPIYSTGGADSRGLSVDANNNYYLTTLFETDIQIGAISDVGYGLDDGAIIVGNANGEPQFSRIVGGVSNDFTYPTSTIDGFGNVYFAGDGIGSVNAEDETVTCDAKSDALIAKYNSSGDLVWLKKAVFGDCTITPVRILSSNNNEIVVVGTVIDGSRVYFDDLTYVDITNTTIQNSFIAKYDLDGNLVWGKIWESSTESKMNGVTFIGSDIFVTGMYKGDISIEGTLLSSEGNYDGFVVALDVNGIMQWVRKLGGTKDDRGINITSDNSQNIFVSGLLSDGCEFDSTGYNLLDSRQITTNGSKDFFVSCYKSDGTLNWLNSNGGSLVDAVYEMSYSNGLIYAIGKIKGTVYFGNDTLVSQGQDIIIVNYKETGEENDVIPISSVGTGNDLGRSIVIGSDGGVLVTGSFATDSLIFDSDTLGNPSPGTSQLFIAKACPHVNVNIFGITLDQYCLNSDAITLEASPAGGTFSGPGISGATFNPNLAGPGDTLIKYDYTDPNNGCTYKAYHSVNVVDTPTVSFTGLEATYCEGSIADTLTPSPTGGVFTGTGITDSIINFSQTGLGVKEFTYTYTDPVTNCSNLETQSTEVFVLPEVSFTGLNASYCQSSQTQVLTGVPSGGVFSANGNISGAVYTPSVVGIDTVVYTITDVNGCENSASQIVIVNAVPDTEILPEDAYKADTSLCEGEDMVITATMMGGVDYLWSNSATGSSITVAPLVDTEYSVTVTDANNCTSEDTIEVRVSTIPTLTFDEVKPDCGTANGSITVNYAGVAKTPTLTWSSDPVQTAQTATGLLADVYTVTVDDEQCPVIGTHNLQDGGVSEIDLSITTAEICNGDSVAVTSSEDIGDYAWEPANAVYINPSDLKTVYLKPSVSRVITVSKIDGGGCTSANYIDVTVKDLPVPSITSFGSEICEGESTTLIASGGNSYVWSDALGSSASAVASPITTKYISVTATALNGCMDSDSIEITVNVLPEVSIIDLESSYCDNEGTIALTGNMSPQGVFAMNANVVTELDVDLYPSGNHTISYSYTDSEGCTNTVDQLVTLSAKTDATLGTLNSQYCTNDADFELTGSPVGGVFTENDIEITSTFSPSAHAQGSYDIKYIYEDATTGCIDTASQIVDVNTIPALAFTNLQSEYCISDASFGLNASPSPLNFRINAELSATGIFDPSVLGGGDHTVAYSYTDATTGCSNSIEETVSIADFEIEFTSLKEKYCDNENAFELVATPVGGSFKVNGASATTFKPFELSGNTTVEYTVSVGACEKTETTVPVVISYPTNISFTGLKDSYCKDVTQFEVRATNDTDPGALMVIDGKETNLFNPSDSIAGDYLFEYSYTNGDYCTSTIDTIVSVHDLPLISITSSEPSGICEGETVDLLATGPAGTYEWSNTVTGVTNTVSPNISETYSVTLTDINNCVATATEDVIVVTIPDIVESVTNPSGCETADGEISIVDNGYDFEWSNSATTSTVSALSAGAYRVTVTNQVGDCSSTESFSLTGPDAPELTVMADKYVICEGESVLLQGTSDKPITWYIDSPTDPLPREDNQRDAIVQPTETTVYTALVSGSNSCQTWKTIEITVNPIPTAIITSTDLDICDGEKTNLIASGGNTYSWADGSTNATLEVDPSTTAAYFVTVSNNAGCSNVANITVVVYELPSIDFTSFAPVCYNDDPFVLDNAESLTIEGNYSGLGVENNMFYPQVADNGTYDITYTTEVDANGCFNSETRSITVNQNPVSPKFNDVAPICSNATPIALSQASHPELEGTYSGDAIEAGKFNPSIVGEGNTIVVFTTEENVFGCASSVSKSITVLGLPEVSIDEISNTCINEEKIELASYGNPAGGDFSVEGIMTDFFDQRVTGIGETILVEYSFEDANGCTNVASQNVAVNSNTQITLALKDSVCSNEPIYALEVPGTTGIFSGDGVTNNIFDATVAGVGKHDIEFISTNSDNCTDTANQLITVLPLPTASLLDNIPPMCENSEAFPLAGSVENGVSGYYIGSGVSNGEFHPSIVTVGSHEIGYVGVNAVGCTDTALVSVMVNAIPEISISADPETVVYEASSTLTASVSGGSGDGYVVTWLPADSIAAALDLEAQTVPLHKANIIEAYVEDSRSCQSEVSSIIVGVSGSPLYAEVEGISVCDNDSTQVRVLASGGSGSYSYMWSTSDGLSADNIANPYVIGSVASPTYSITVTDEVSLNTVVIDLDVTLLASPEVTKTSDTTICAGEDIELNVDGGSEYHWDNGLLNGASQKVSPLTTTTYTIESISDNGCSSLDQIVVGVNTTPVKPGISYQGAETVCQGDSVLLQISEVDGYAYLWSNGITDAKQYVKESGKFSVKYSVGSCSSKAADTIVVTIEESPVVPVITYEAENLNICSGDSVVLTATSDDNFIWSTGAKTNSIIIKTTSSVSLQTINEAGCVSASSETVDITVETTPFTPFTNVTGEQSICLGDSIKLSSSSATGYNYLWSNDSIAKSIYVSKAGTYNVKLVSENGCESDVSDDVIVNVLGKPSKPELSETGSIVSCNSEPVIISSEVAEAYAWSNGATTNSIIVTESGKYAVQTINEAGCLSEPSDSIEISLNDEIVISISGETNVCQGELVTLTASGAESFAWSNETQGAESQFELEFSAYIYLTATNSNNCTKTDSVFVTVNDLPELIVDAPVSVCSGQEFTVISNNDNTVWNDGIIAKSRNVVAMFDTVVTASIQVGNCSSTVESLVNIKQSPQVTLGDDQTVCEGLETPLVAITTAEEFEWSTGETSHAISTTEAGVFTVTVSANGCSSSDNIVINRQKTPALTLSIEDTECGESSGSIDVNVDVDSEVIYQWVSQPEGNLSHISNLDTNSISDLAAGVYVVTAFDGVCLQAKEAIVNDKVDEPILESVTASKTDICKGESVMLTATGTTSSYIWTPDGSLNTNAGDTVIATPDSTTIYVVMAHYENCLVSQTIQINVSAPDTLKLEDQIICSGDELAYTVKGYDSYLWSNGDQSSTFRTLESGEYSLTASNGTCKTTDSFTVTEYSFPEYSIERTSPDCGESNGSIEITSSSDLKYIWENGSEENLLTTKAGVYSVDISDKNCSVSKSIVLSNVISSSVSLVSTDEVKIGDTVYVSTNKTYESVSWELPNDYTIVNDSAIYFVAYASSSVEATVVEGDCNAIAVKTINVSSDLIVDLGEDTTICHGATIELTAPEADSYIWNTGEITRSIIIGSSDVYSVTVTKGVESNSGSVLVLVEDFMPSTFTTKPANCESNNGAIDLTNLVEGVQYSLNGTTINEALIDTLQAGIYVVEQSTGSCTYTESVLIESNSDKELTTQVISDPICDEGEFNVVANGAESITWFDANGEEISDLDTLVYTSSGSTEVYAQVNVDGCIITSNVELVVFETPKTELKDSYSLCTPTALSIIAGSDAYNYVWSNGSIGSQIEVDEVGDYSVTISNDACEVVESILVEEDGQPEYVATVIDASCGANDGAIAIDTDNINIVIWESGFASTKLEDLSSGVYSATIYNGVCSVEKNFIVSSNGAPQVEVEQGVVQVCSGEVFTLTANGADEYVWTDETGMVVGEDKLIESSVIESTTYTVEGITNGCSSFNTVFVTVKPTPVVTIDIPDYLCHGSKSIDYEVSPLGGQLFVNSTPVENVIPSLIGAGTHLVKYEYVNESTNCSSSVAKTIDISKPVDLTLNDVKDSYCEGELITPTYLPEAGQIFIDGVNASVFDYSSLMHNDTISTTLTYVSTGTGCTFTKTVNSLFNKKPVASFDYYTSETKVGFIGSVEYADNLTWNFGNNNSSNEINPEYDFTTAGEYSVSLIVANSLCDEVRVTEKITIRNVSVTSADEYVVVSPNPFKDVVYIQSTSDISSVSVINLLGEVVYNSEDVKSDSSIDLSFLPVGVYTVITESVEGTSQTEIIKE